MERHIIFPSQTIGDGAPLFTFGDTTRVVQLDTEIDAEEEERKVQTQTDTVTPGDLLVELIPEELTAALGFIRTDGPNISCIEECRQFDEPPHLIAVLEVHIQFDIAYLQVISIRTVDATESTRTERTGLPAADTVCAATEIAFLER